MWYAFRTRLRPASEQHTILAYPLTNYQLAAVTRPSLAC
jgi:hypothetical protein